MRNNVFLMLCTGLLLTGCSSNPKQRSADLGATSPESTPTASKVALDQATKERVLALNPENVTSEDVRDVLSNAPAPRIINIHGGILPVQGYLVSFSQFLAGMGYPEASIRNPRDGTYTFGYYDSSEMIAGIIAWYYEQEGMRPILVGHSQGGFQAVRVLYRLAGHPTRELNVWNPLSGEKEDRILIVDPLTRTTRPVVGLQVSYAAATVAGGLARLLPNQWSMNSRLRYIPDSTDEFTGFQKGLDILGGDFLGYGPSNDYESTGKAVVRNVRLPSTYGHTAIPDTKHLAMNAATRDWIDNYRPPATPGEMPVMDPELDGNCSHILWAAEIWYGVKKHWVTELQRLIRAERSLSHGG
jgi:hypothetical protein